MRKINLRLFDGGAAGGAGTAGAAGTAGTAGGATGTAAGAAGTAAGAAETGTGTDSAGADAAGETGQLQMTPEQRLAEYNRMKEEYKDLYSEDVQRSINRMHAKNQKLTEQMDKHTALIDMLAVRYGVEGGDVSQIMEQIEKDDAFFESKAMEEGMTVEQYKKYAKMEAENRRFQEAQEQAANMRQRQDMYARWDREREACEQKYPGFDMEAEVRDNPEFVRLLGSGVDVTSAYQAVHFDDIMRGVIKSAEASTKKRVVDTVRAGVARPAENAAGSTQPSVTSIDINGMSKEEFAKLVADIQSGKVKTL